MKPGCVSLMAIAGIMIGATAGKSDTPEPRPSDLERGNWGVIQGRVTFSGEPPAPRVIADPEERITKGRNHQNQVITFSPPQRLKDYEVMAKRGGPITSERLIVDPRTKGVRNALVYLVKPTAVSDDARRAAPKTLRFRADRGVFVPHVLAAMQGAKIQVDTDDLLTEAIMVRNPGTKFHVTNTTNDSRLLADPQDYSCRDKMSCVFGNYSRDGRTVSSRLEVLPEGGKPIPMPVHEEIHYWMSGWWMVLDHPYFAVTDEGGNFAIRDVPTGPQEIAVWHESVATRDPVNSGEWMNPEYVFQGNVAIENGHPTVKDFVIEPRRLK